MSRKIGFAVIAFWFVMECVAYYKHSLPAMGLCVFAMCANYFLFKKLIGANNGTRSQ